MVRTLVRQGVVAALATALAGCLGPGVPPASTIHASDGNVRQPVLRAAISIPEPRGAPSNPQTGHALELGFTRGSGSSSQTLASNYVGFGGKQFTAPATLDYDFTLTYLDMAYRFRAVDAGTGLGFEALSGIALAELDFRVASPSQQASESLSSPGLQVGLGALWRPRPGPSLHARAMWFSSYDYDGVSNATRVDVYLAQAVWRHATLRAGYSWWSLESDRGDAVSPISVEFRGPALGLELMF